MIKKILISTFIIFAITAFIFVIKKENTKTSNLRLDSMQISQFRLEKFPGSKLKIESKLSDGSNYRRYTASYYSEGLKIYGLLTIPNDNSSSTGFPAIILNHGYITPEKYTSDGNYIAYVDAFAKNGYIVFKPDYRGNGKSQGVAGSEYFSRNYDIDDLNAIESVKEFESVNPNKIGIWGHSMGGHITLMDLEVSPHIKAASIWGGVVGSYNDILYNWQGRVSYQPDAEDLYLRNLGSKELLAKYGTPQGNPDYWNSIDPIFNLNFVNAPLQIHVGLSDNQVPPEFSQSLFNRLKNLGKNVELYEYPGANHDISMPSFEVAMKRTLDFFDKYLK